MVSLMNGKGAEPSGGAPGGGGEGGPAQGPPVRIVRYGAMNWVGDFSQRPSLDLSCSAKVVVQTERGIELGEYLGPCGGCPAPNAYRAQMDLYVRNSGPEFCQNRAGRILRLANEQDIREQAHLNAHVVEDVQYCAEGATRLGLDMKVITAEHLLGGERIVFYFRSEGRIDFRQLVRDLAQRYRTRIEMRQVGARDEARLVADFEICGRECCCKSFLKKLRPVNMKMAKLQKSTLDPTKVSGRCGRLRCCLRYEHVGYEELAERLPRIGSRVATDFGPATVLDRQVLTQLLSVRLDDDRVMAIPLEEIRGFDLPPAPPKLVGATEERNPGGDAGADADDRRGPGRGIEPGRPQRRGSAAEWPEREQRPAAQPPAEPDVEPAAQDVSADHPPAAPIAAAEAPVADPARIDVVRPPDDTSPEPPSEAGRRGRRHRHRRPRRGNPPPPAANHPES